jgi:cysteine desulfurase family protein (TIGR01976 family)
MFDPTSLREQFPALRASTVNPPPVFLDGPGGTQVPDRVIDAMTDYLSRTNANTHGLFRTSRESDQTIGNAHQAIADMINAPSAEEVIFGPNMTTLTFAFSRAYGKTLHAGDEIMVTRMDHDANISPWRLAARDAGAKVVEVDIKREDCTLDYADFEKKLDKKTKLVAVTCASNAVGTINDVAKIIGAAHAVGAHVFLDAVHYAPHGPIDVTGWQADFLVCSVYKLFGPHVGALWGRHELLDTLPVYKVRPVPDALPERWMTGTQNHEGLAGTVAAVEYLAEIGRSMGQDYFPAFPQLDERSLDVHAGMAAIRAYESELALALLDELAKRSRIRVWGITAIERLDERVPTISISVEGRSPEQLAAHLASRDVYVWNGNMYAPALSEALGLEKRGGFLRIGLVHYNTFDDIDRLLAALDSA